MAAKKEKNYIFKFISTISSSTALIPITTVNLYEVTPVISHSRPSIFNAINYFYGNQSSSLNYDCREYKFVAFRRCYIQNVVYQFDKQVTKANSIFAKQTLTLEPEIICTRNVSRGRNN